MGEDPRATRTRAAIKRAAQEMVVEMPLRRITVKAIADCAGINRKTFYLHYPSVEYLFQDLLDELMPTYWEEMDRLPQPVIVYDTNRVFFAFWSRQPDYVQRMLCDDAYRTFVDRVNQATLERNRERSDNPIIVDVKRSEIVEHFLMDATLSIYRRWHLGGRRLSLVDIIDLSSRLMEHGVQGLTE